MDHCIKLLEHHKKFSQNQKRKVLQGHDKQCFVGIYRIYSFRISVILQLLDTNETKCNRTVLIAITK